MLSNLNDLLNQTSQFTGRMRQSRDMSNGPTKGQMRRVTTSIFILKLLLAFYTVPHNMAALGITEIFSPQTLGLLVYELAFLISGIVLAKGLVEGDGQSWAMWGSFLLIVIFMAVNAIYANFHHAHLIYLATLETGGLITADMVQEIPQALVFYKNWIVPTTPPILVALFVISGFVSPKVQLWMTDAQIKNQMAREKLSAQLTKAQAEMSQEMADLEIQTGRIVDKVQRQSSKFAADQAKRQAELTIELSELEAETKAKQHIAEMSGVEMVSVLASPEFKDDITKKAKSKAKRFLLQFQKGDFSGGN